MISTSDASYLPEWISRLKHAQTILLSRAAVLVILSSCVHVLYLSVGDQVKSNIEQRHPEETWVLIDSTFF